MTEATIIEQLRLQEGRLFQNERTLALYLDLKAVVAEAIVNAAAKNAIDSLGSLSDAEVDRLLDLLQSLAPQGVSDYHAKSLHECVKSIAKLLWPSQMLLVARPRLSVMIAGMLKRLAVNSSTRSYADLDPIKQDFIIREAFRRCLVNDCLIIFDSGDGASESSESEVGPDDSASRIGGPSVGHAGNTGRPYGARSAIGPVEDEGPDDAAPPVEAPSAALRTEPEAAGAGPGTEAPAKSVVGSVARSVARSVVYRDDQSVAPKVVTVQVDDAASSVSKRSVGANSVTSSVVRRPMNVRKIHIDTVPEE